MPLKAPRMVDLTAELHKLGTCGTTCLSASVGREWGEGVKAKGSWGLPDSRPAYVAEELLLPVSLLPGTGWDGAFGGVGGSIAPAAPTHERHQHNMPG